MKMLITKQGSPKAGTQRGKRPQRGKIPRVSPLDLRVSSGLAILGGCLSLRPSHVLLPRPLKTRVAAKAAHSEKSEQALLPGATSGSL